MSIRASPRSQVYRKLRSLRTGERKERSLTNRRRLRMRIAKWTEWGKNSDEDF